jgi:protein deglycase
MSSALVLLAPGFEEIEAVTAIDVLRRAGVDVEVAGLTPGPVTGSHAITIQPDRTIDGVREADFDSLILPGGMPGAANLKDDARVLDLVRRFHGAGKLCAAICAAPIVFEAAGILKGRRATSYPGFELPSASYVAENVVEDGPVMTSRGVGTALEFALAVAARLENPELAGGLAARMLV